MPFYHAPPLFGTEYQYVSSEGISSNSSENWQTKLTLTTPIIPTGNYRMSGTLAVANDSGDKPVEYRYLVDGVPNTNIGFYAPKFEDEYDQRATFLNVAFTEGVHVVQIQFRATSEGGTAKCRSTRIDIFRTS